MKLREALELLTVHDLKKRCSLIPVTAPSPRKGDLVATISRYLLTGDLSPVWSGLSELEINAVAETVHSWDGVFAHARFSARYGSLPQHFGSTYSMWSESSSKTAERRDLLSLFFYQYGIPEDLCPRLAALAPRPTDFVYTTLTDEELTVSFPLTGVAAVLAEPGDATDQPLRHVATEALVAHDLPSMLRLIGQGGVAVGPKTGLPSSAAVTRIESVLLGGDWYAAEDDQAIDRWEGGPIRPIRPFAWTLLLQAGGLAKLDVNKLALTPRGTKALSLPPAEVVAGLFERWQTKGAPDELRRVDVIKGQTSKGAQMSATADRRAVIAAVLRDCPVGCWLDLNEFFRQMQYRGRSFTVSHNPWNLYINDPQYGGLGDYVVEILQTRYCLVYLFEYLATLGMIDVAYTLPYGARTDYGDAWGTDELLFLSRYDGLRYLRINPLGAYCLGLAPEYRPLQPARPTLLAAEGELGLRLLREPEPAERLILERIARLQAGARWDLDSEALLQCSTDTGERARIRDFLTIAFGGDLPAPLGRRLDAIAERVTALVDTGSARLVQCRDEGLAGMLAEDPATGPHCLRAGARLICVPESKLKAFRKGLVRLDLILPEVPRG
ncbi:hypothetical protein [uncultured Lamprocystis sp.]|jgi:hypothetical protein|uniref:hypothetical protein n=1 Tax=uncultured Lamprocystis sp. TaxID=543132 RepID=UPI0025E97AEC|nr:hypothetical protein [uncultured Lamprocystis sp.]